MDTTAKDGSPRSEPRVELTRESTQLIGCTEELDSLVEAVVAPPAVVVVSGEPGVGKTRLLAELAAHPRLAGRPVLRGSARRLGEPFPLGPLVEALRGQEERLAVADLPALTGVLRTLLPELAPVLPPALEPLQDTLGERHRVFRAMSDLLAALGPLVLIIEDLHTADVQTVEMIGQLIAAPPSGLALVVSFREEELEPWVLGALAAAGPVSLLRLRLRPLDPEQTRALASAILGVELSEEFATYLWERASGIPFAIEELLALLQTRGMLIRRGSRWVRRTLDRLDVPYRIRDTVLERASRLSPAGRTALQAVAVLQVGQPVEVIESTCAMPTADVESGLDEALAAGLLVEDGEEVAFRHLLAALAVYEDISPVRRRRLHARAAAALSERTDPAPGHVAHHLHRAGRLEAWAEAAEAAASRAVDMHDEELAGRLLSDVLRDAPLDPVVRTRIALRLARAATVTLADVPEVTRLIAEAIEVTLEEPATGQPAIPQDWRGELRLRYALLLELTSADPGSLRQVYLGALEDLEDPALRAWAMTGLGIPQAEGVEPSEHRDWLHQALELIPDVADPVTRIFLRGKVAMVLVVMGDPAWRALADGIVEDTDGVSRQRREVNAYDTIGIQASYAGHHRLAAELLRAGYEGAQGCESPQLELRLGRSLALLDFCRGRWDGLAQRLEVLADDLSDVSRAGVDVESVLACLTLAGGDLDTAQQLLEAAVDRAESLGANDLLPLPAAALVRLRLGRGEPATAVELGTRVLRPARQKGVWAPALRVLPPLVEALVATGRAQDGRDLVAEVRAAVAGLDTPLATPVLAHAAGHLADDGLAAAEQLAIAAAAYDELDCGYEAAQALEAAAGRLEQACPDQARGHLLAALDRYRALPAAWDEARVHRLARRLGVSVPARHRRGRLGYGETLSPREREVAVLVARGDTNTEIGRELHLSVKTVEKHVGAAKQKLRAPTRAAFARLLSDHSGGFSP